MNGQRLSAAAFDEHPLPPESWPAFDARRPDADRAVAADITFAEQLRLAGSTRARVRRDLAGNPALHPEVQSILAKDGVSLLALASNPGLSDALQRALLSRGDVRISCAVASHSRLRPHVQLALASDPRLRAALARNERLSASVYESLWARGDLAIRFGLAGNPSAGEEALLSLARDQLHEVRARAAANPRLPPSGQRLLLRDDAESVRVRLAGNPSLCTDVQLVLARDTTPVVWALARNTAISPLASRALLMVNGHLVHILAGNPSLDPALQQELVRSTLTGVRATVAAIRGLPLGLQEQLANDPQPTVRAALTGNPGLDPRLQWQLAEAADPVTNSNLFCNPGLGRRALRVLLDLIISGQLHWFRGQVPRVPALGLATHWTPASLDHPVRGPMVAMLSGKPRVLDAAAGHGDPLVRWGLLCNDRIGARRLGQLIGDGEPVIGHAARLLFIRGAAA